VTVTVNFDQYGASFFNPDTTQGSQARATLNAAATFYSNILNDTLAAIVTPSPFTGSAGTLTWSWDMVMNHPSASGSATLSNQTIATDEFRIYAGAENHSGTTAAIGGPGGASFRRSGPHPNSFTSSEQNQISAIESLFFPAVENRGEAAGTFAAWGGTISLDTNTNWHFDHTTLPALGKIDLYSVAIHEMAHALGFGIVSESYDTIWESMLSGSKFGGAAAVASYGGQVPLAVGNAHWQNGVTSTVYGGSASQVAIMTSNIVEGSRLRLTTLDAAALTDLGWSLVTPPPLQGDYNRNGVVDAADYVQWRNTRGQNVASGSGADGSGNGNIDQDDYTIWRSKFGNASSSAAGSLVDGLITAVPETSGSVLATVAYLFALCARRKRRG
jgi:hypothetical protein